MKPSPSLSAFEPVFEEDELEYLDQLNNKSDESDKSEKPVNKSKFEGQKIFRWFQIRKIV